MRNCSSGRGCRRRAAGGGSASWLTASLSSQFGIQEDDEQQHEHMKIDCVFGFSFVFSLSFGFFLLFYSHFISILARLVRIAAGVCEMYMNFFYWVISDRVTSNGHDTCCIIHLASQYQLGNLMSTTRDLPENFTPKLVEPFWHHSNGPNILGGYCYWKLALSGNRVIYYCIW